METNKNELEFELTQLKEELSLIYSSLKDTTDKAERKELEDAKKEILADIKNIEAELKEL